MRLASASPEFVAEAAAQALVAGADHAGDEEEIDQPPDEADEDEIAEDLEDRGAGPAEVKPVRRKDPEEEPQEISDNDVLAVIGDALLDQQLLVGGKGHLGPPVRR